MGTTYQRCPHCGTSVNSKYWKYHENQPACIAYSEVERFRREGYETLQWGKTELQKAGVDLTFGLTDVKMVSSQLVIITKSGYWVPKWVALVMSWVAQMANHRYYAARPARGWDPPIQMTDQTHHRLPPQSGGPGTRQCKEEKKFLATFFRSLQTKTPAERDVIGTELMILGGKEFKLKFWEKIYPGVPIIMKLPNRNGQ